MALTFLQVTDHHLGASADAVTRGYATGWALQRLLDAIGAEGAHDADFLICTGDLVDVGDDIEYAFARRVFGVRPDGAAPGPLRMERPGFARLPAYFVPGNHDPRARWLRNLFPATPPREHLDLSWTVDGVVLVYLDLGTDGLAGQLRDSSLAFLDEVLARGLPTVIVLHHHPVAVGIPWLDRALPEGVERLWQRLGSGQVLGVLFGHAHATVEREVEGVPVLGLRSTCFQFAPTETPEFMLQPLHYRVLTVEGGELRSTVFEVPLTGAARSRPAQVRR